MSKTFAHKHKPALKQGTPGSGCRASLPPHVGGQTKGRLHVRVASLQWAHSIEPPSWTLAVRLRWWGEDGPGTVFRVPVKREGAVDHAKAARGYLVTQASYSIKSSRPKFAAYLRDMHPLVLEVGLGRVPVASLCVGTATVSNIKNLVTQNSVEGEYPVVDRDGVVLARLQVHFHLEMDHSPVRSASPPPKAYPPSPPQGRTVRFDIPGELISDEAHVDAVEGSPAKVPPWVLGAGSGHEDTCRTPLTEGVEPGDLLYERLMQKSHKLRESLVRSLLSSKDVWEEVEQKGRDLEWDGEHDRVSPEQGPLPIPDPKADVDQTQPLPLGGVLGCAAEGGMLDDGLIGLVTGGGVGQWAGTLGRVAEDSESEVDLTLSSESSDHPLRDPSLLDKLVYAHPPGASDSDSEGEGLPSAVVVQGEEEKEAQLTQGVVVQEDRDSDRELGGGEEGTKGKAAPSGGGRRAGHLRRGLGRAGQLREGRILKLLGLERLTTLGRVGAVRVEVGQLELDQAAILAAHHDVTPSAYLDSVFFVEYHFPVTTGQASHRAREAMRVASRKIAGTGVVSFNHCSLIPASFTRKVICDWWQETVVFRVYIRLPQQRTPRLIGKCSMRLQGLLRAGGMELESALGVHPADLSSAFSPSRPGQTTLGTLTVKSLLVPKGGRKGPPGVQLLPTTSQESSGGDSPSSEEEGKVPCGPPLEKKVVDACPQVQGALVQPPPAMVALQLLLFLPEAVELTVQPGAREPPNGYVVCRLFCTGRPPPATDVVWSSLQPQFNHRLVFPLALTASLLSQLCNGVMVAEVWHKTAGTATEDQLLGLVKVSLSQFHLAFADTDLLPSLLEAEYPVIAMDSYCPVTNPLTGSTHGHLGVLLALGSSQQVSHLMQHYASGKFLLRRPYPIAHSQRRHGNSSQQVEAAVSLVAEAKVGVVCVHTFEVTVEAVRSLPALNTAIWGEADCFVQYHFPGPAKPHEGEEGTSCGPQEECPGEGPTFPLLAHRTPTVLCIPDPVLDQSQCHTLPLPPGRPVQHVLLAAYPSHGVPFEVWKRFYYPNTRDQLVAKGHLPLAKLCALVTMNRVGAPGRGQPFTIPLTPTGREGGGEEAGVLHVRVAYSCEEGGERREKKEETSSLITLSVGVLRACGLKEAAETSAAEREPLVMGQPAREGVNAFVKLRLPQVVVKDIFETKPVARTFCPEFSHHFAIALPLDGGGRAKQPLAEALWQSGAVFEVWHKVDQTAPQTSLSGGVTSRCLQRPPKEVLLGVAEVPLSELLARETGVHGWLPIVHPPAWPPAVGVDAAGSQELGKGAQCVGGLEVSLSFASKHHRELVLQQAYAGGWCPRGAEWGGHECVRWHLSITRVQISKDSVRYPTSTSLHKLCYLRYKVYDRKPTVTAAHRTAGVRDGVALFHFSHSAATLLPVTESLKWYLKEECLELQVWLSGRAGHHRSRPSAEDTLLGCCYIPLSGLSPREAGEGRVQGSYPLFKPGASSLGGSCVQVGLSLQPGRLADCKGLTHEMEISDSSDPPSTVQSSSPSHGDKEEEKEELAKAAQAELQRQLEAANLFDATLHIHQAVPAKDTAEGCASAYAVVHPHPLVERITTPCAPFVPRPSWNHRSKTKIPRELLDSHSQGLQVQVWLRTDRGVAGVVGVAGVAEEDRCLGCATVDLSPLGYGMPLLSGWYNVGDFAGQCVGQLQVTVVPDTPLRPVAQGQPLVMVPLVCSSQSLSGSGLPTTEVPDGALQLADKTTSFLRTHLRENISELEELRDSWTARLKQTQGDVEREELRTGNTAGRVPPAEEVCDLEGGMSQRHSVEEEEEEEEEEEGSGSNTPLSITPDASGSDEEGCSTPLAAVEACCTGGPATDEAPPDHEEPVRTGPEVDTAPTQEEGALPSEDEQPPPSERAVSSSSCTSSGSGSGSSDSEGEGSDHRAGTALPSDQEPHVPPDGDLVRGPRLPNFFLPPQELEETMRSLRLAALSRPPPAYTRPPPGRPVPSGCSSLVSTPERLEQSLEQLLRSYRQGRAAARPKVTFDAKETDRIARIFASKPNVS